MLGERSLSPMGDRLPFPGLLVGGEGPSHRSVAAYVFALIDHARLHAPHPAGLDHGGSKDQLLGPHPLDGEGIAERNIHQALSQGTLSFVK